MVNATFFQIFRQAGEHADRTDELRRLVAYRPGLPEPDAGDPIVVYDHLADRWRLSEPISRIPTTCALRFRRRPIRRGNVVPVYVQHSDFPDYPKYGVWPNGYYMTSYQFPNLGIYVFDRTNMLLGFAAGFMKTAIPALGAPGVRDTRILPGDLDGRPSGPPST